VAEGRPHVVDMIKNREVSLIVNTVEDRRNAVTDSRSIRTSAVQQRITYFTTMAGARAACEGIPHVKALEPYSLQSLHRLLHAAEDMSDDSEKVPAAGV
jgi:carbamoyl-phosphate synthase large subunit